MKKLMKKKVSMFGKEFSVFAIAVVSMMVLVSAALVPYISNQVSGDATVDSPLALTGSLAEMTSGTIYGGNQVTKELIVTNFANQEITYSAGFEIVGPDGST